MNIIIINKHEYILVDELFEKAPVYCKGSRNGRELMKKKNISDYIYGKSVNNKWIQSDGKSIKFDKVFIKKTLIKSIPEFNQEKIIIDDNNVQLAPDIIHLEDNEKFRDENNNIVDIETRGSRQVDGIYFKVKDVKISFKMENFDKNILDKKSYFKENEHYKYFLIKKVTLNKTSKIKKELYLTYEGMLRVLFASHSPNVKPFIKWAVETLFTIQIGTSEQKQELCSSILGVNVKTLKHLFSTSSNKTPCVYLFYVTDAQQINPEYSEDEIVCKFGCSDDLERRTSEHNLKYKKEFNRDIELLVFSIIDPKYIFEAEENIKQFFESNKVDYKSEKELIIIKQKDIKKIKEHYKLIQNSYIGRYQEMNNKINELEKELIKIKYEKEIMIVTHDNELKKKDIELRDAQIEYQKQEIELLRKFIK